MPDIDPTAFKEEVAQELAERKTFHFKARTAPYAFIVFGGFFIAMGIVLVIYLGTEGNAGSLIGFLILGVVFVLPGIFMLHGYVEVTPTLIAWKILGKPHVIAFRDLQAYALIKTTSTRGGTFYSCRVYLHSGKSKTIRCSGLQKDRPLPKKMKSHEFLMSLMSAYLQHAGVPRYTGPV